MKRTVTAPVTLALAGAGQVMAGPTAHAAEAEMVMYAWKGTPIYADRGHTVNVAPFDQLTAGQRLKVDLSTSEGDTVRVTAVTNRYGFWVHVVDHADDIAYVTFDGLSPSPGGPSWGWGSR